MPDDDGPSSTPWGRPGDSGRRGGTPTPPTGGPGGGPAPDTPPATMPASPVWPGGQAGPPAPAGSRPGGLSGGALAALIAVVVVALVLVGGGVFLVTMRGGGDDGDAAGDRPGVDAAPGPTSEGSASSGSAPVTEDEPDEGGGGGGTDPLVPTSSIPDLPTGTEDLAPPPELPQPDGAAPDALTGGLAVPGTAAEAAAFYEGALPGAGYTVARNELPGVAAVLTVTGGAVSGQLVFIDIGLGATTVLWTPT